jgi:N-methylhydantoinase B/oxoprolinase/acetone carboxylase alpha subunit
MNNLTFGGVDPETGQTVAYYVTVCAGEMGAAAEPGWHVGGAHSS